MEKVTISGKGFMFEGTPITTKEPQLEDDEFSTNPGLWRVKNGNGKYIFSCISGAQGGKEQKADITKDEYNQLVSGSLTANDICLKYSIG